MSKLVSPRPTLLALLAVALLLVSFTLFSTPVQAVPSGCKQIQSITTYYSDATHHTIVGTYFSGCQGGCTGSGSITSFYTIDHLICVDP